MSTCVRVYLSALFMRNAKITENKKTLTTESLHHSAFILLGEARPYHTQTPEYPIPHRSTAQWQAEK